MVCTSKQQGGLGILKIETQNIALLLKSLHKFYNRENLPWVELVWEKYYSNGKLPGFSSKGSFWWRDLVKLINDFKGIASVQIKDGKTCLLWQDLWNGLVPMQSYPELFSFAKNRCISVQKTLSTDQIQTIFHLPSSQQAFAQMQELFSSLDSVQLVDEKDSWIYIWNSNDYSSQKAYKQLSGSCYTHPIFSWTWKSFCQPKHKVFFWLLLKDRLSTRGLLRRRNMQLQDYNCVLCNEVLEETREHLFLQCPYAQECWMRLGFRSERHNNLIRALCTCKAIMSLPFAFDIIILWSWSIWMARNDLIFRNIQPSIQRCIYRFKEDFSLVIRRSKRTIAPQMKTWIESFL